MQNFQLLIKNMRETITCIVTKNISSKDINQVSKKNNFSLQDISKKTLKTNKQKYCKNSV